MEYQKFTESYPDYRLENFQSTLDSLTFAYKSQSQKESIAEAVCFWKHLRNSYPSYETRSQIYKEMKKDSNSYIAIVVAVEALPEKVWRKLLWRENIDFLSFESFLRRLEEPQREAIMQSAEDLHGPKPKVPKVFKKRLIDYILVLLGFINLKKLNGEIFSVDNSGSMRYESKGAWAFNLLGIDFGFSLYPGGVDDDTKITNKKWTRFLSIKEHINDFIVNQEDGIYWWMYRGARSFLVHRPDKDIYLKDHVCPGFWATLIFHLYFWIIGPVLFFSFLGQMNGSWFYILILSLITYTPLYVAIWTVIGIIVGLIFFVAWIFPSIKSFLGPIIKSATTKAKPVVRLLLKITKKAIFAGLIITPILLIYIFYPYVKQGVLVYYSVMEVYLKSGILQTTLLTIWLPIQVFRLVVDKKWNDLWTAFTSLVVGMTLINLLDSYVMKSFVAIVYAAIPGLVSTFLDYAYIFLGVLLICSPLILVVIFSINGRFKPENYYAIDVFILWFTRLWSLLMVSGFVYIFYFSFKQSMEYGFFAEARPLMIILVLFALIAVFSMFKRTKKINKKTVGDFLKCQNRVSQVYSRFNLSLYEDFSYGDLYLKNKAIIKMPEDVFEKFMDNLREACNKFRIEKSYSVIQTALLNVKEDGTFKNSFKNLDNQIFLFMDEYQKKHILLGMLEGKNLFKLRKEAEKMKAVKEASKAKVEKKLTKIGSFFKLIGKIISYPFIKIGQFCVWFGKLIARGFEIAVKFFKWLARPFVWCAIKVRNFFVTLKDLWDLFNNRCPEVSRSKDLHYND